MRRGNDWERRYGRRRRAIDRALLEELERRERLARAFGRPA